MEETAPEPTPDSHTSNDPPQDAPPTTWADLSQRIAPGDAVQTQGLVFHPEDTNRRSSRRPRHRSYHAVVRVRSGRTVRFDDQSECEGETEEMVSSSDAAEGQSRHTGIILKVDDGDRQLHEGKDPIVDVRSLPYFLPVSPAQMEQGEDADGKTYETGPPVSKMAGNPDKRFWIYVRWASKIHQSDTSLTAYPSQERYSAGVVKIIKDEIEKHERKSKGSGEL
ncbi:hypothetical protein LXA43DRAFT_496949 [Ganoderma leucocontextum]|nr:hypothetical protein LXA43DRAFT_496949 [Ganoderma leucocontextum]